MTIRAIPRRPSQRYPIHLARSEDVTQPMCGRGRPWVLRMTHRWAEVTCAKCRAMIVGSTLGIQIH